MILIIKKIKENIMNIEKIDVIFEIIELFMMMIGLLISKEIIYISIMSFLSSIFSNLYIKGRCL